MLTRESMFQQYNYRFKFLKLNSATLKLTLRYYQFHREKKEKKAM